MPWRVGSAEVQTTGLGFPGGQSIVAEMAPELSEMTSITPGDCPTTGAVGTATYAVELSGETTKLCVMPGKVRCAALDSAALLIRLNVLSEDWVPLPLKTKVWARFGVSTIKVGVLPAEMGAAFARTSSSALTINTPADSVPALTLFVRKARYLMPLVFELLGVVLPQLSSTKQAGGRNNSKIRAFFKP